MKFYINPRQGEFINLYEVRREDELNGELLFTVRTCILGDSPVSIEAEAGLTNLGMNKAEWRKLQALVNKAIKQAGG